MSHIDSRITLALTVTRGKRAPFTVDPLPDEPAPITQDAVAEFNRRITEAATVEELVEIAADLKACDLGSHRKQLQEAWGAKRTAISADRNDNEGVES